jgi:ribonuclease HIII
MKNHTRTSSGTLGQQSTKQTKLDWAISQNNTATPAPQPLPSIHMQIAQQQSVVVGTDECLKGDTFAGLIVAGVLIANPSIEEQLRKIGVADSKKINDEHIPSLATAIKTTCDYCVQELYPSDYNKAIESGSLTRTLNSLHSVCAQTLKAQYTQKHHGATITHIVDEFPGCACGDLRMPKAESLHLCVAAASILARDAGLKQFDQLSQVIGFTLPKGSTHVTEALLRLKRSGKKPELFVKMHFSNVKKIL